jgi:hypothetical protein
MPTELENSPNFIHAYKMEGYKHCSVGGQPDPCMFLTKPSRPPSMIAKRKL